MAAVVPEVLLCVLAGVIYILLSTPDYRATASVEVEDVPAGAAGAGAALTPDDPEAFAAAWAEGERMTEEQAVRYALARDG